MPLLDKLFEASFRGARFLIVSAVTTGGRKQVLHEYPNSDKQKVEDLGFKPRSFSITAIVSEDPPNFPGGLTYLEKRDALLAALEQAGNGTLSHPFFTNSIEVTARPYTLNEDLTTLGSATIDLVFDFSDEITDPIPATTSLSQVNSKKTELDSAIEDDIANNWSISNLANFEAAEALLEGFSDSVESATRTFNQISEVANEFSALINDFSSNINQLARIPGDLATSVTTIIQTSQGLYQTLEQSLDVFNRLFDFGDDIQDAPNTTPQRAERNKNNDLIKNATQIAYLSASYQFASEIVYTTVDDVVQQQTRLEQQYEKILDSGAAPELLEPLAELRVLANSFLEQERLTAPQLITVQTKRTPISILAFAYYGEDVDTLLPFLVDNNRPKSNDPTFIEGDVEVLTI